MVQAQECSDHARIRMQQRGVGPAALDLLLRYGRKSHDHHGGVIVYMDSRARGSAVRECGRVVGPIIDKVGNLYAVLSTTGSVLTVGHRYRRIFHR